MGPTRTAGEVFTADAEAAATPEAQRTALEDHWKGAFRQREVDRRLADESARPLMSPLRLGARGPPAPKELHEAAQHACASAPGPDGIPYRCWADSASLGGIVLVNLMAYVADGGSTPPSFNRSWMVFLPKPVQDG